MRVSSGRIWAWLPEETVLRRINRAEAIKNLCIAMGGDNYAELIRTHSRSNGKYVNPEAAAAFDAEKKATILRIYGKYLRTTPLYAGFPYNESVQNIFLQPPTVEDFRKMLAAEAEAYA